VEIFGNVAFEDLVAGLTQMDLVAPEKRYDRLMVGTKQIGKDVDVIGVEALEGVGQRGLHGRWARIIPEQAAPRSI